MGGTPKLFWFSVIKKGRSAGEVLLAAELLLNDKVKENPSNINTVLAFIQVHYDHSVLCSSGR